MTHKTGVRHDVVDGLVTRMHADIGKTGATISEVFEAVHHILWDLKVIMLRPWEDETCPTCPKDMQARGDQILHDRSRHPK